jgi:hypothetical protein
MMKPGAARFVLPTVLLIASVPTASDALAGGYTYTTIASAYEYNGAELNGLDVPVINDKDEIAFDASTGTNDWGVFLWRPSSGHLEILDSAPAGIGYPYTMFAYVQINKSGAVAFDSITQPSESHFQDTPFVYSGQQLTQVAPTYRGAYVPYYSLQGLLDDGSVVFRGNATYDLFRAQAASSPKIINPGYSDCGNVGPGSPLGYLGYTGVKGNYSMCGSEGIVSTNALTRKSQVLVPPGDLTYGTLVENATANDTARSHSRG